MVFVASVVALLTIELLRAPALNAPGVAHAPSTLHPAPAASHVAQVHVRPGDQVERGDVLVTLADETLRHSLEELDLRILIAIQESQLAQAELAHEDTRLSLETQMRVSEAREEARLLRRELEGQERMLDAVRVEAERLQELGRERLAPSERVDDASRRLLTTRNERERIAARLSAELGTLRALREASALPGGERVLASARLHEMKLELLQAQRAELAARIDALDVRAAEQGIVAEVSVLGANVAAGGSVARVVPASATEVVAYLPPETRARANVGGPVHIAQNEGPTCTGILDRRVGAEVSAIPGRSGVFGATTYGRPLHIELPENCELDVGQQVWVSLEAP